jgi:hypothetical protein
MFTIKYALYGDAAVEAHKKTGIAPQGVVELQGPTSIIDFLRLIGLEWPEGKGLIAVNGVVCNAKDYLLKPNDRVVLLGRIMGG